MPEAVLDRAEAGAVAAAASPLQAAHFRRALQGVRDRLAAHGSGDDGLGSVYVPRTVYAVAGGIDEVAISTLTAALTLLYVGMDLWDKVLDEELGAVWQDLSPAEVSLIAAALIGGAAPALLVTTPAPAQTMSAMQRALARRFAEVAAGQQLDMGLRGSPSPSVAHAEAALAGRGGAVVALFAELAALLAGAPDEVVGALAALAHAVGVAAQLRSDLYDLLSAPVSRDLAAGCRTLPLALAIERFEGAQRDAFVRLLREAATDAGARNVVRERLYDTGVVAGCAVLVECTLETARSKLDWLSTRIPSCEALRIWIDSVSIISDAKV